MKKYFWIIFEVLKRTMSLLSIALQFAIISLYSSKLQALSALNPLKMLERPTFTLRASHRDIPGIALYLAMLFVVTKLSRLIGK